MKFSYFCTLKTNKINFFTGVNKNILIYLFTISSLLSCSKDDFENDTDIKINVSNKNPQKTGDKMIISFYDPVRNESSKYETVRIGEYLWTTSNINHYPTSTTLQNRDQIDLTLNRYRLNPEGYNVSVDDINKYFGPYYTRLEFEEIEGNRYRYKITENEGLAPSSAWGSPSNADVMQLFAMCGEGDEHDIRTLLTCQLGQNPAVVDKYTYWFSSININKYGFNLMPGGARFNGNQNWKLEHNHNSTDSETFSVVTGDFYGFLHSAVFYTWNGRVTIDDYVKIDSNKIWHWMAIRWCRKLTDQELGYKLYTNSNQTDIIKLNLTDNVPNGYTELKNGALRGFYVQNRIDGINPNMSIAKMKELAQKLSE